MNVVSWKAAEPLIAQSCHTVQVQGNLPRCQKDCKVLMTRTAQTDRKGCWSGLYECSQMVHLTMYVTHIFRPYKVFHDCRVNIYGHPLDTKPVTSFVQGAHMYIHIWK